MERHTNLDDLIAFVWQYFERAARDPDHPARTPTFGARGPTQRTVVLRRADADERALAFHTDLRSDKVETLREDADVSFHHWNPERMMQFRLRGAGELHVDDPVADEIWEAESEQSREHYRKAGAPGSGVDRPRSTHPSTDDVEAPEEPRSKFAAVRCIIESVDWLHLHPEGHYRAQFDWTGTEWQGQWVVP